MKESPNKQFDHFLHPYIFILKEGKEIHQNFLDYSLLLLQVSQGETLSSPNTAKSSNPSFQLLKK